MLNSSLPIWIISRSATVSLCVSFAELSSDISTLGNPSKSDMAGGGHKNRRFVELGRRPLYTRQTRVFTPRAAAAVFPGSGISLPLPSPFDHSSPCPLVRRTQWSHFRISPVPQGRCTYVRVMCVYAVFLFLYVRSSHPIRAQRPIFQHRAVDRTGRVLYVVVRSLKTPRGFPPFSFSTYAKRSITLPPNRHRPGPSRSYHGFPYLFTVKFVFISACPGPAEPYRVSTPRTPGHVRAHAGAGHSAARSVRSTLGTCASTFAICGLREK